jgi:hypothetical protein
MPVVREFRFFVSDGKVRCGHEYWPLEVLREGGISDPEGVYATLCRINSMSEMAELAAWAGKAGAAVPGYWSIDILETERGWMVTDMAQGDQSFHMPGCGPALALRA